ncbi:MAG: hypothetical protein R3323_06045 [Wenzhouxiangellaceae bacterium]|nr:hypothetical protein [Wenzhouxiangellaceae bacterium]
MSEDQKQKQQKQIEAHNRATAAFIDLANKLAKEDDQDPKIVSAGLMAASGVYATFIAAGNEGFLGPEGVEKVAGMYRNNLAYIQDRKKHELQQAGKDPKPLGGEGQPVTTPYADELEKSDKKNGGG